MNQHTIAFDFDGVIHSYIQPWIAEDIIPDLPVKGIKEVIDQLRSLGYRIVIISARAFNDKGKNAISNYLKKYEIIVDDITNIKIPAMCYIDDRCICFNGNTNGLVNAIRNFTPWNR